MSLVLHPIVVALEKVQEINRRKSKYKNNAAEKVEASDVVLHTLFQYFTKETFLLIPLVCKRWGAFRTECMWRSRLLRDFDLDASSLTKQPDIIKLYKKIYTSVRTIFRESHNFGLKPENLVVQLSGSRLSRSYSM
jgi:hypothetical protein